MKNRKNKILVVSLLILVAFVGGCALYLGDYYRAEPQAEAVMVSDGIAVETLENGDIVFFPREPQFGLIFYPGGKVEHTAYAPLMSACAEKGILCVLVEMPFRLAVLDVDAADGIPTQYSMVEHWYIGGHSLGGSMAASYLESHQDHFDGLILLGAYSTADLSSSGLSVISLYGSEDQVMNREKYQQNETNLPSDYSEIVIEGGNHAGFGMYGIQKGDGTAGISNEDQIAFTAERIFAYFAEQIK